MIGTLKTLISGVAARTEEQVRHVYSIELIDQKIREAETSLKSAKLSLASLIQRQRTEQRHADTLGTRIADLIGRAGLAMDDGREDLATEAAQAVADMENELALRTETLNRLEARIMRLKQSVEAANRRIIDLKQGAVQAKAVRREQVIQGRLQRTLSSDCAADEAMALIENVLNRDDPFEQSEILSEIDNDLSNESITDRMAEQGFGAASKVTANDVLNRIKK